MVKINTDWDMAIPPKYTKQRASKFRLQTHTYNLDIKV